VLRMSKVVNAPISLWITGQVSNWIQIFLFGFGESGHRGAKAKRPGFSFNKMFLQAHRTSVGRKERSCSSQQIRAPCAAPRPLLRRLSRTLCTSSSRFTDTFVTGAGRSNRWLCFVRRRCNRLAALHRYLNVVELMSGIVHHDCRGLRSSPILCPKPPGAPEVHGPRGQRP
jgi:hypothetical protein